MKQEVFKERLLEATKRAVSFARDSVIDTVPDEVRYDLLLVPDDRPTRVAPELEDLWKRSAGGFLPGFTMEQVVAEVWHQERVPEWIDFGVNSVESGVTFVEVRFSRTLSDDDGLWHESSGIPPFKIVGPPIPDGFLERHSGSEKLPKWSLVPRAKLLASRGEAHRG